tara:strand:+ start:35 stop:613 length:579 start_codon:yes stop_codon:yes gene_type:complete
MPKVPIDYSKGFIYKLCCLDVDVKEIYIGSSTNFKQRKNRHKCDCNRENSKLYNSYVYRFIRDNGGWDNWTMIELHKYPCNDKRELECEENRVMIELQSQLNSQKAYQSKEDLDEYIKKYREEHKEETKEYNKKYIEDHKEQILEYNATHKEIINMKKIEKIACDNCGCFVCRSGIYLHKTRKKCINFKKET